MRGTALILLALPGPAFGHDGAHAGWTLDAWVTVPLLLAALLYARGLARLRRRSGRGRRELGRQAGLFTAGWALLAGALVSPLHEAGERSFTMHMIEHEILMLPAALLLVASRPGAAMMWALPAALRRHFGNIAARSRPLWRALTDPLVATALQALAMWAWHAPALFDRALQHDAWHIGQHISFLIAALLFWWAMAQGRKGGHGAAALCLFLTSLIGGALGALMALSASPWYEGYAALGLTPSGLTPVEDQQLAGLLMWIPGGLFHAAAALFFLWKWLRASEVRDAVPAQ
jgi:cytochrome c oxidase assembly factor CtaG